MTALTERIESEKARIKYLERTAAMSAINVNLSKLNPPPPPAPPRPYITFSLSHAFHRALVVLGHAISRILEGAVYVAVIVGPVVLVLALVLAVGWRTVRAGIATRADVAQA